MMTITGNAGARIMNGWMERFKLCRSCNSACIASHHEEDERGEEIELFLSFVSLFLSLFFSPGSQCVNLNAHFSWPIIGQMLVVVMVGTG